MRRRAPAEPESTDVPPEIAEGPRVSRWAAQQSLQRLAAVPIHVNGRREAVDDAMLSARGRYGRAREQWLRDAGMDRREAGKLVPSRKPYFDEPGTPAPSRTGYAAEPQASNPSWMRRPAPVSRGAAS